MDVRVTVQQDKDWIHLAKDGDQGQNTVYVVMFILFLRDTSGLLKGIFCLMVVFLIFFFKMSVFGLYENYVKFTLVTFLRLPHLFKRSRLAEKYFCLSCLYFCFFILYFWRNFF